MNFRLLNASLDALAVIRELRLDTNSLGKGQWRGRCPFHHSEKLRSRSLAISLPLRKFLCHSGRCGAHGDLIDLSGARPQTEPVRRRPGNRESLSHGTGRGTVMRNNGIFLNDPYVDIWHNYPRNPEAWDNYFLKLTDLDTPLKVLRWYLHLGTKNW